MKIDNSLKSVGGAGSDTKTRAPRSSATAGSSETDGSRVDLSPLASQLQHADASLTGVSEINSAKVGELKQAISEGRFKVNPEKVADGLIESVRQMLQAQPSRV